MKYLDAYEEDNKIVLVLHTDETKTVPKTDSVVGALQAKGVTEIEGDTVPDPSFVMTEKWLKYRPQPIHDATDVMLTEKQYMANIKRETELLAASELAKTVRTPISGFTK